MATTPVPAFVPPPDFPALSDRALGTYNTKSHAWATAIQSTTGPNIHALAVTAKANADDAALSAGAAANSATQATTNGEQQVTLAADQVTLASEQVTLAADQVTLAAASATAAAGSALVAGAVAWVGGATYAAGNVRYSPINLQTYRRISAGAGTIDPSLDATNWALALDAGIGNVVTATGMTTLTNTPTLLQITPASYGVTVTLPAANACKLGGPLHIIDNRGAYPVRVCNASGVLKGFIFAGVVSHVSLSDNSTTAGVWAIENSELVGASAQLLTTNFSYSTFNCVALDGNREVILGVGSTGAAGYACVYDKSTNTFGPQTVVRTGVNLTAHGLKAVLSAANQLLVISIDNSSTNFQAVTLSITGTTITVNTAATATLSANISSFADGCGLIAVGSSFVTSYRVATPAAQIRALSVSGTTVTIGAATVLDGTTGGLIAAAANHVIAVSTAGASLYTKPYLVAASTLSAGTGTTTTGTSASLNKVASLGARWLTLHSVDGGNNLAAGVVSLSTSGNGTTTISTATCMAQQLADAIVVSANKVLILGTNTAYNANILTDTAGTASAGTAITLSGASTRACHYVSGTDVFVGDYSLTTAMYSMQQIDCSGASPVSTNYRIPVVETAGNISFYDPSNAVLSRSPRRVHGSAMSMTVAHTITPLTVFQIGIVNRMPSCVARPAQVYAGNSQWATMYRGKAASEIWQTDAATVITKIECAA